jgi:hypothetical protein
MKKAVNSALPKESHRSIRRFSHAKITQIANTTTLMLADMRTPGGKVYKTHRVYERDL